MKGGKGYEGRERKRGGREREEEGREEMMVYYLAKMRLKVEE